MSATQAFRDRIVEFKRIPASELRANPKNWRLHPESQKGALTGILKDIGFTGAAVARKLDDGTYELLDGHLRTDIAGSSEIPVLVVDLNDEEASKMLATFDPLSTMAVVDEDALSGLLETVDLDDNAELRRLLSDLQDRLIAEEDEEKEELVEVPGMALQPHEHYDYLVVLATTSQEWNLICDRLKLKPEKRRGRMGTCRAVRAGQLIAALDAPASVANGKAERGARGARKREDPPAAVVDGTGTVNDARAAIGLPEL